MAHVLLGFVDASFAMSAELTGSPLAPLLPRHRMLRGNPGFCVAKKRCNNKGGKISDILKKCMKDALKTYPEDTWFTYMNG